MNLKELAENLGLSQTTVSRALNGYPEVSEATRDRVVKAAEASGYAPNARAKGLATGRSMAIGHVIAMQSRHQMMNPIFGDFLAGAGESYADEGYDMMLSIVTDQDEAEAYRTLARKGSVDGVILHGPQIKEWRIDLIQDLGLPFVVHGRTSDGRTDYSWCDVPNRTSFETATKHLIDLGHRRIALINGLETMDFAHRRRLGFCDALKAAGLSPDPDLMVSQEMTEGNGHKAAARILDLPQPPTAFVTASLISAIGVRRAVRSRELTLPGDVSLVTFDDDLSYFDNGGDAPPLTSVRSSVREAGRVAGRMLLDQIARPGLPPQNCLLPTDLVPGQSSGPAPHS